jgi:triosephosphate isomerase
MATRKPCVGGNWKMNLHHQEAMDLTEALAARFTATDKVETMLFPALPYMVGVANKLCELGNSGILVGAQDAYHQPNGAFTGEVSVSMLNDAGVRCLLVGHSERRHVLGENDELINAKLRAGLDAGLTVVLCVGEKLEQRERNQTDAINAAQVYAGLAGVSSEQMQRVVIAYEPVWAIGTGKTATPADAQAAHAAIRGVLANMCGSAIAEATRIQYGGSVKPGNAAELFAQPDIDGGLIGGASLKPDDFVAILEAAASS